MVQTRKAAEERGEFGGATAESEQSSENGGSLQWTNGLGSSSAFLTLLGAPSVTSPAGSPLGTVPSNVWHSGEGDVSFAAEQSNTQQLLASTEKVQRNYGNAEDSSGAQEERSTVTAISFSEHIYSPSSLISTADPSIKPELDAVVVSANTKSPSLSEDQATVGKTRIIWTDDLREILIEEMKKRPCLWNHNHPKYRDPQYAASERNEVIESFYHRTGYALNAEDIARQWKSLRDQFVRFINKIRNMEPSDVRFPSFKFSEELKFLMPFKQLQQSRYCVIMNEENGLQDLNEHVPLKNSCSEFPLPGTSSSSCLLPPRRKRKHGKSTDYKIRRETELKTHDKEDSLISKMDEFDHFGLSIADYIRGIAKLDEKAAVWIRGEIWTLLTKCRMKALEGCSGDGSN